MANKILKMVENSYKPFYRLLVKYGWEMRLYNRVRKMELKKLTYEQKKEIKDYWKQFNLKVNTNWAAYFYTLSGVFDKKYIPESLYYSEIQPSLNNFEVGKSLSDKNISDHLFTAKMPKTILRKVNNIFYTSDYEFISLNEAVNIIKNESNVIIKPANGSYGDGITFWDISQDDSILKKQLNNSDDIIVQEVVKQHPELAKFHKYSLNTVRVVTLRINHNIYVLNAILRMGRNKNKIDNYSAGGVIANLSKNGSLFPKNTQANGEKFTFHPDTKVTFAGESIVNFDLIIDSAISQHRRLPYFNLISWDYGIDELGDPVLIEGNYPSGQLDLNQLNNGGLFGQYTDQVLTDIYLK